MREREAQGVPSKCDECAAPWKYYINGKHVCAEDAVPLLEAEILRLRAHYLVASQACTEFRQQRDDLYEIVVAFEKAGSTYPYDNLMKKAVEDARAALS